MKNVSLLTWSGLCLATISLTFCTKDAKLPNRNAIAAVAAADVDPDGALLAALFQKNGPQYEFFQVDASKGAKLQTRQGSVYVINPDIFVTQSGTPASGTIDIQIKEIFKPSDMLLASRPTTVTDGRQLESFGEFIVNATQKGEELNLKAGASISVQAPTKVKVDKVPLWGGDTTVVISNTGYDDLNQPTKVSTPASNNRGISWNAAPGFATFNGNTGALDFLIDSIRTPRNCDTLRLPVLSTTLLGFMDVYNDATQTSYTGSEPSQLFYKPAGQNTLVKLSGVILNAATGRQGLLSAQSSVPIGQSGTLIAISAVKGSFYAQKQTIKVPAPTSGQNFASVNFKLSPVSGDELISLIRSIDQQ